MIESIRLANSASFDSIGQDIDGLSKINFFYGANGVGKTTISRVIEDVSKHPDCRVRWKNGIPMETHVYNRDFVERNFSSSRDLKGVYTLGEENIEIESEIANKKAELSILLKEAERLRSTLGDGPGGSGKRADLARLEEAFKHKCWLQKQKHDEFFKGALKGYRGSAEMFRDKVLEEAATNSADLLSQERLIESARKVFASRGAKLELLALVDANRLISHEKNPILTKPVIGKAHVDIAAMISKLGNSDWVRAGRKFHDVNDDTCPFCQQPTPSTFAQSLADYFDETYLVDSRAVEAVSSAYAIDARIAQQQLDSVIDSQPEYVDVEALRTAREVLAKRISENVQILASKKREPSRVVELQPVEDILATINELLVEANKKIDEQNKLIDNIDAERSKVTSQVWRFVVNELKAEIDGYRKAKADLNKAITGLGGRIAENVKAQRTAETEIQELERKTTSVEPTIAIINRLLGSFGFDGFKLAIGEDKTTYKILRADGSDAKSTLSEGELTFIAFLYFYHQLRGSLTESGTTASRVVVIDDPVSSLDSNILFIVASLIKGLFDEVESDDGPIKQVLVLTHNIYFHKEVSFNKKRSNSALKHETFWIVRRQGLKSTLESHDSNPIRTSYELLWMDVKEYRRNIHTLQNTLRRILEIYFTHFGGIELKELPDYFEGSEKMYCAALTSWMHDGSHNAHDDLYISMDPTTVSSFLEVFRLIFEKTNHEAHYKMMMGIESTTEAPNAAEQTSEATTA
ncbi:MAG: AAA family ATPase [Trueperaceae bacterium]